MNIYCIAVRTGAEDSYRERVQARLNRMDSLVHGTVYFLKKHMKLKNGKEYYEAFFPGYVFLETEETSAPRLLETVSCKDFLRFLPANTELRPLVDNDLNIVTSILQYGSTIGIIQVTFDEGDHIIIQDGPFKNFPGKIVAVNRRNKRVNIQLDFMNGLRVVGLTYEEVKKFPTSEEQL